MAFMKLISRSSSTITKSYPSTSPCTMGAWHIYSYGDISKLSLSHSMITPHIKHPNDLLIRVHASSINPVDAKMINGYGARTFNMIRKQPEFPFIPGCDFSGVICGIGQQVANEKKFKLGDEVMGALPPYMQGTLADYTCADANYICHKPPDWTMEEAASVPYAGLTAWNALCDAGGLIDQRKPSPRVLVLGSSGGVGVSAVQIAASLGATVICTCPSDAVPLMKSLGAYHVVPRGSENRLSSLEPFNVILNCLDVKNVGLTDLLAKNKCARYVTLCTPVLSEIDSKGLFVGLSSSAVQFLSETTRLALNGQRSYRWSFFSPSGANLEKLTKIVRPVIDKTVSFDDVTSAFAQLTAGSKRGKIVIQHNLD